PWRSPARWYQRMSRRSGCRFADKDTRQRISVPARNARPRSAPCQAALTAASGRGRRPNKTLQSAAIRHAFARRAASLPSRVRVDGGMAAMNTRRASRASRWRAAAGFALGLLPLAAPIARAGDAIEVHGNRRVEAATIRSYFAPRAGETSEQAGRP